MAQTNNERDASIEALFEEMERRIDPARFDPDRDDRIEALFSEMHRRIDAAKDQKQPTARR